MATKIKAQDIDNLEAPVLFADGTVSLPPISFGADTNTGIYRIGADDIAIATNGIKQLEVSATAITTFLPTAIKGTTTNDSASAGYVGEVIQAVLPNSSRITTAATGVYKNITSISLTAGDWIVSGQTEWALNGATMTSLQMALSAFSGSTTTDHVPTDNSMNNNVAPTSLGNIFYTITSWHVQLTGSATYYVKGMANYSAGTPEMSGKIIATRIR